MLAIALLCAFVPARAQTAASAPSPETDPGWPRQIDVAEGRIIIYQPQPESLEGNVLKGRAAVSITLKGKTEPVFGALWFESQVNIDRDTRLVEVIKTKVPRVRIADAKEEQQQQFIAIIEREVGQWQMALSYDRLLAGLDVAEMEKKSAEGLNTAPPIIIFEISPAILVLLDGEPRYSPIVGDELLYMTNTEDDVFMEIATQNYYVALSGRWYRSKSMKGPWEFVRLDQLPASFKKIPEKSAKGQVLAFVACTQQAQEAVMDAQVPQTAAVKRSEGKVERKYSTGPGNSQRPSR